MNYVLTSLIDDPNNYKVFSSDDEFDIDIEERYLLGYFDTEKELEALLISDNYWYRESPEAAREDAENLMDNFEIGA